MRFGYNRLRRLALSRKHVMVAIGLLTVPAAAVHMQRQQSPAAQPDVPKPPAPKAPSLEHVVTRIDPRIQRLTNFFSQLHCPVRSLAEDFIKAADENHIDWRLLPSISVIESGGGKAYRNNNIFGWNNGAELFPSIRHGIREVAYKLGRSPLYRHRDTEGKLRTYNGDENYIQSVLDVMNRISPEVDMAPVHNVTRRVARPYELQRD